ncbi:MAG: hypothetical protein KBC30_07970 [Planctomycetes bacterium]|nr:hypothetical protein [Planctomycetota bacterium]
MLGGGKLLGGSNVARGRKVAQGKQCCSAQGKQCCSGVESCSGEVMLLGGGNVAQCCLLLPYVACYFPRANFSNHIFLKVE